MIPQNLTNAQKEAHVDRCKKRLNKYDQGASKAVCNITDTSWIYAFKSKTIDSSLQLYTKETHRSKWLPISLLGVFGEIRKITMKRRIIL